MLRTSDRYVPESQQWFMELMLALGYFRCDLISQPSFDDTKFETFYPNSNFVFVISNEQLYFVDQANHKCQKINVNKETLIELAAQLPYIKQTDSKDTVLIENLSFTQLKLIESLTGFDTQFRGGMCHGVATMAIPTNLLDSKKEIQRFNRRFRLASLALPQRGININFDDDKTKKSIANFVQRFNEAKQNVIQNLQKSNTESKRAGSSSAQHISEDIEHKIYEIYEKISTATSLEQLEEETKTAEAKLSLDKAILELRTFFDGVGASQSPRHFKSLFEQDVKYQKSDAVMPLITPVLLDEEEKRPVKVDKNLSLICDQLELEKFFKLLKKYFQGITFSMIFYNGDHSINISFHSDWNPPWVVTDANDLPAKLLENETALAEYAGRQLFSKNGMTVFCGELYVHNKNKTNANNALNQLTIDPEWQKLRKVTRRKATKSDTHHNTWLQCAALANDEELVAELLELGADPVQANNGDRTPYTIAAYRNSKIALTMWKKLTSDFYEMKIEYDSPRGKIFREIANELNNIKGSEFQSNKTEHEISVTEQRISQISAEIAEHPFKIKKIESEIIKINSSMAHFPNIRDTAIEWWNEQKKSQEIMLDLQTEVLRAYQSTLNTCQERLQTEKDIESSEKNNLVNRISIFKQLEEFIEMIKTKLLEEELDEEEINKIFEPVYNAFPDRRAIVKHLSNIVRIYGISDKFHEKDYNKLEILFLKENLPTSLNRGLKLVTFLTKNSNNFIEEFKISRSHHCNAPHFEIARLFLSEINQIQKRLLIDLRNYNFIDTTSIEKIISQIILQHYNEIATEHKDDQREYLIKLEKFFSQYGINLSSNSLDQIIKQFQINVGNVILPEVKDEKKQQAAPDEKSHIVNDSPKIYSGRMFSTASSTDESEKTESNIPESTFKKRSQS